MSTSDRDGPCPSVEERDSARAKLAAFALERGKAELLGAREEFYGSWLDALPEVSQSDPHAVDAGQAAFDAWFQIDRPLATGARVIDELLASEVALGPGERAHLERLSDTVVRLYEVEEVSPGESFDLIEPLTGERVRVSDDGSSEPVSAGELLAARVIACGPSGQPEIEVGLLPIPDLVRDTVLDQVAARQLARDPEASDVELYRSLTPDLHDGWMTCVWESMSEVDFGDGGHDG